MTSAIGVWNGRKNGPGGFQRFRFLTGAGGGCLWVPQWLSVPLCGWGTSLGTQGVGEQDG